MLGARLPASALALSEAKMAGIGMTPWTGSAVMVLQSPGFYLFEWWPLDLLFGSPEFILPCAISTFIVHGKDKARRAF